MFLKISHNLSRVFSEWKGGEKGLVEGAQKKHPVLDRTAPLHVPCALCWHNPTARKKAHAITMQPLENLKFGLILVGSRESM